jgi:leader peptidase (prepilin peptidase)/N-methyltransferase
MTIALLLPLLLGWFSGWLVNYLTDVLPTSRRLTRPACPKCHKPHRWSTYLLLRPCAKCGQKRGWRAPVVQAVMTVTPALLWTFPRQGFPFSLAFLLLIYLAVVLIIDLEHRLILHPVSLVGAILGAVIGIWTHGVVATLIGGAAGFGIMLVFYYLGEWYVRFMAKRKGIKTDEVALGFGDVNLSGILGLLLGWPGISFGLLFAVFVGGLVSLTIILGMVITKKYQVFTAIPYAPFLILSALSLFFR